MLDCYIEAILYVISNLLDKFTQSDIKLVTILEMYSFFQKLSIFMIRKQESFLLTSNLFS